MSGPGLNLNDMGIGTTENADTLARPPEARPTADDMLNELAKMVDNEDGVAEIEQASEWQAPEPRPLRPDTSTPRPVVIDPTAENQPDNQTTDSQQAGEGGGTNDVTPAGGELSDTGQTATDGLPFALPPTGDDQTASPGGDGGTSTEPTQEQSAPTIDLNSVATQVFGQNINENQARDIFRLAKDLEGLSPSQLAAINQVVNGGYIPQQQPTQQPIPQPYPQQPIPNPTPYQPNPTVPSQQYPQQVDSYQQVPQFPTSPPPIDDPELAQYLAPIYQQQQQLAQAFQQQQAILAQQQQQRLQQEADAARQAAEAKAQEWRTSKQNDGLLTDAEYLVLEQRAIDSGFLPVFNQQFGDAAKAVEATLDYLFTQDPTFQERVIAKRVQEESARQVQQQQRTNVSTALSGGGGQKPTAAMQPITNGNPRRPGAGTQNGYGALVDEVRNIMQSNQN